MRHRIRAGFVILGLVSALGLPGTAWPQSYEAAALSTRHVEGPDEETKALLVSRVRALPVSELDAALPPISIDEWLLLALGPKSNATRETFVDWSVTFCPDRRSAIPGPAAELCVEAEVSIVSDQLTVHLLFAAARLAATSNGPKWEPTSASLFDIYIDRQVDSADVSTLRDLPAMLDVDPSQWPAVDLETRIAWTPSHPAPGSTVRVSVFVGNTGRRSLERAAVTVVIGPCCSPALEVKRDWFPAVPAGQWLRLDLTVTLPEGQAIVVVNAAPGPSLKAVRETNRENNDTTALVGDRRDPDR